MTTRGKRLLPHLTIGAGMIVAAAIGTVDLLGEWRTLASAVTLASAILGADAVDSMLRYGVFAVSWGAALLGGGLLLATWICRDSATASLLLPSMGAIACLFLMQRSKGREACCGSLQVNTGAKAPKGQ